MLECCCCMMPLWNPKLGGFQDYAPFVTNEDWMECSFYWLVQINALNLTCQRGVQFEEDVGDISSSDPQMIHSVTHSAAPVLQLEDESKQMELPAVGNYPNKRGTLESENLLVNSDGGNIPTETSEILFEVMDIPDENENFVSALEIPEGFNEDVKPAIYTDPINTSKVDSSTLDDVSENSEINSLTLGEMPISSSSTLNKDIVETSSEVYQQTIDLSEFVTNQSDSLEIESQGDDNEIWLEIKSLSVENKDDDTLLPMQDTEGSLHEKDEQSNDIVDMNFQESVTSDIKTENGHLIVEETLITYLEQAEVGKMLVSDNNEPLKNILGCYQNLDSFSNELDLSNLILESERTTETTDSCLDMTKESIDKEAAHGVKKVERAAVESTNIEPSVEKLQTEKVEQDFVGDSGEIGTVKELDEVSIKESAFGEAESDNELVEFQNEETIKTMHSIISDEVDQAIHVSLESDKCDDLKVKDGEKCLFHIASVLGESVLQNEAGPDAKDFQVAITDEPSLEEGVSDNSAQNSEVIRADLEREVVIQEESVACQIQKEEFEIDVNLNESPLLSEEEFVPCNEIPIGSISDDKKHEALITDTTADTPKPSEELVINKDFIEAEKASHDIFDSTSVEDAGKEIAKFMITPDDQGGLFPERDKNDDKILTNLFLQSEELKSDSLNISGEEVVENKKTDNTQTSDVPQQVDMEPKQVETLQESKMSQKASEEILKKDLSTEYDLGTSKTILTDLEETAGADETFAKIDDVQETSLDEECSKNASLKDQEIILTNTTLELMQNSFPDSESNTSNNELLIEEHDIASKGESSVQPVASENAGNDLIEMERTIEDDEQDIKWMPALNIEENMNSENQKIEARETPGLEVPQFISDALGEGSKSEVKIVEIEGKVEVFPSIISDTIETANFQNSQEEEIKALTSNEIQDQLLIMEIPDMHLTVDSQPIESETNKDVKTINSVEEGLDRSKESSISASGVIDRDELMLGSADTEQLNVFQEIDLLKTNTAPEEHSENIKDKFVEAECIIETELTQSDSKEESNKNDSPLSDGNATELCLQEIDVKQTGEGQNISELKDASVQDKPELGDYVVAEAGHVTKGLTESKDALVTTCFAKDESEYSMCMEVTKEIEYLQISCSEIVITDADELNSKLDSVCQEIEIMISDAVDANDELSKGHSGEEFSTDTEKESEFEKLITTTDNGNSENAVSNKFGNMETSVGSEDGDIKPSVEEVNEIQKVEPKEEGKMRTGKVEEENLLRHEDPVKSHDEAEAPFGRADNEDELVSETPEPRILCEDTPEAESSKDKLNCENIPPSYQFKETGDSEERTAPDRSHEEVNSQEQPSIMEQKLEVQEIPASGDDADENEKTKENTEASSSLVQKSNEDELANTIASYEELSTCFPLSEPKESEAILENTSNLRDATYFENDDKENILDKDTKIVETFAKAESAFENEHNLKTIADIPESSPTEKVKEFCEAKSVDVLDSVIEELSNMEDFASKKAENSSESKVDNKVQEFDGIKNTPHQEITQNDINYALELASQVLKEATNELLINTVLKDEKIIEAYKPISFPVNEEELKGMGEIKSDQDAIEVAVLDKQEIVFHERIGEANALHDDVNAIDAKVATKDLSPTEDVPNLLPEESEGKATSKSEEMVFVQTALSTEFEESKSDEIQANRDVDVEIQQLAQSDENKEGLISVMALDFQTKDPHIDNTSDDNSQTLLKAMEITASEEAPLSEEKLTTLEVDGKQKFAGEQVEKHKISELIQTVVDSITAEVISAMEANLVALEGKNEAQTLHFESENANVADKTEKQVTGHDEKDEKEFLPDKHADLQNGQKNKEATQSLSGEKPLIKDTKSFEQPVEITEESVQSLPEESEGKAVSKSEEMVFDQTALLTEPLEKVLIEDTKSFEQSDEIETSSIKLPGENDANTTEKVAPEPSHHEITDEDYRYLNKFISDVLDSVMEELINKDNVSFKMAEHSTENEIDNKAKEFYPNGSKNIPCANKEITQNDINYALELASQVLKEATNELLTNAKHKDEKLSNENERTITSEKCKGAEVESLQTETENYEKETQPKPTIGAEKEENQSTSEVPGKETNKEVEETLIDATVPENAQNTATNIINEGEKHETNESIEHVNDSISGTDVTNSIEMMGDDAQTSPEKGEEQPSNQEADLEGEKTRNLNEDEQESKKTNGSIEETSTGKQIIANDKTLIKDDEFEKIPSAVDEEIKLGVTEQDLSQKSVEVKVGQENEDIKRQATTDNMREEHEIAKTLPDEIQNEPLKDINPESDETRIIMDPDKSPTQETKSEIVQSQTPLAITSPSASEHEVNSSENIEPNVLTETESKPSESQEVEPDVELQTKSSGETFSEILRFDGDGELNVSGEAPTKPDPIPLANYEDVKSIVQSYALEEASTSSHESVEKELVIQEVSGEIIEQSLDEMIEDETGKIINFKDMKSLGDEQLTMHDQSAKVILIETSEAFKETESASVIDVQEPTCKENDTQPPVKESHILQDVEELVNEIEIVVSDQDPNIPMLDQTKIVEVELDLAEKDDNNEQRTIEGNEGSSADEINLNLEKDKNLPNANSSPVACDPENTKKEAGENSKEQKQLEGMDLRDELVDKDEAALTSEPLSDLKVEILNQGEIINVIEHAKADKNDAEENKFMEPIISKESESSIDEQKSVIDEEQVAKDEEKIKSFIVQQEDFNEDKVSLESQEAVAPDNVLSVSTGEITSEISISELDMANSGNVPDKMIETMIDEVKVEIDVKHYPSIDEVLTSSDYHEPLEKQIICEPSLDGAISEEIRNVTEFGDTNEVAEKVIGLKCELDDKSDDVAVESDAFSRVKVEVTNPEEIEVVHVKPSEDNTKETKLVESFISDEDEGFVEKGEFEQIQTSEENLSFVVAHREQVFEKEETVPQAEIPGTNDVHSDIMKISDIIGDEQTSNSLGTKESTVSVKVQEPTSITDSRGQESLEYDELNITSEEIKSGEAKLTITDLDHVIEETETQISNVVHSSVDEVKVEDEMEVADGQTFDERNKTIMSATIDSNLSATTTAGQIVEFEFKPITDQHEVILQKEEQLILGAPQESSCENSICKFDDVEAVVKEESYSPLEIECLPRETVLKNLEFVTGALTENKAGIEINSTDEEPAIVSSDSITEENDNFKDFKDISLPVENVGKETTDESSTVDNKGSVDQQISTDSVSIVDQRLNIDAVSLAGDKEMSAKTILVEVGAPEVIEQESIEVVEATECQRNKLDEMKGEVAEQVGSGSPDDNPELPSSSCDVEQKEMPIEIDHSQKPSNVVSTEEPLLPKNLNELKPSTISDDEKLIDESKHVSSEEQITNDMAELEVTSSETKDSDLAEETPLASENKSPSDQTTTENSEDIKSNTDGIQQITPAEEKPSCEFVEHKEVEENIIEQTRPHQETCQDYLTLEEQINIVDETKDTTSDKVELVHEDGQLANTGSRQLDSDECKEEITFNDQSVDGDKNKETFETSVKGVGDIPERSIVAEQSESSTLVTTELANERSENDAADHRLIPDGGKMDALFDIKPVEKEASMATRNISDVEINKDALSFVELDGSSMEEKTLTIDEQISGKQKSLPAEEVKEVESLESKFVPEGTLEVSAIEDKSSFDKKEGLVQPEEEKTEFAKDTRQSEDVNVLKQSKDLELNDRTDENNETLTLERSSEDERMEGTDDMKSTHKDEENKIDEKLQASEGILQGETTDVKKDVELIMVSSEETITVEILHSEINKLSPATDKSNIVDIPEVIDSSEGSTSDLVKDDTQQIENEIENFTPVEVIENSTALIGQGEQKSADLLESVVSDIDEETSTNSELSEVTIPLIHSVQEESQNKENMESDGTNLDIEKGLSEVKADKTLIADCQETITEATQMVCVSDDVKPEKLVSLDGSPDKVQIGLDVENVQDSHMNESSAKPIDESIEKLIEQNLELQSIKMEFVPQCETQSEEAKEGSNVCGDTREERSQRKIDLDGSNEISSDSVELRDSNPAKKPQVCPSGQINEISITTSQDVKPIKVVKLISEESKSGTFQDQASVEMKEDFHADENLCLENLAKEVIADLEFVSDTLSETGTSSLISPINESNELENQSADIPNQHKTLPEDLAKVDVQEASPGEKILGSSPEVLVMENKAEMPASVQNEIPSIETNRTLNDRLQFMGEETQDQIKESQFVEASLTEETKWESSQQENSTFEKVVFDVKGSLAEESNRIEIQKNLPAQESEKLLEIINKNEGKNNIISSELIDEKTTESIDSFVESSPVMEFKQTPDKNDRDKSLSENSENIKISEPKSECESVPIISDDVCKTKEVRLEKTYRALSPEEEQQTVIPRIKLNLEDELTKLGIEEMNSSSLFISSIDENRRQLVKLPNEKCSPEVQLLEASDEITWTNEKTCTEMEFTVLAGSSATISIPYKSESTGNHKVTWKKMNESDGSVMEDIEGFEQSDGTTSLVLKNVDRIIHGGTYAVYLEDEFGVCSCKVHIVVKDKPGAPESPKFALSPDDEAIILLNWSPPKDDGGDKVLRYMIERCDSSSNSWVFCCSVPGDSLQVKVPTLLLGRSSSFRIAAENTYGLGPFCQAVPNFLLNSDFSGSARPWFVQKLPFKLELFEGKPFALYCSNSKNMGCKPWFIKKLPEKFKIEKGGDLELQCDVDSFTDSDLVDFKSEASSLNLQNGTASFDNEEGNQTTDVPCAPASLTTAIINRSNINISWTPPRNSVVNNLLGYVIEKRDEGSDEWTFLAKLPPDVYECELGNMSLGKGYFLRVSAENRFGIGPSRELSEPIRIDTDQLRAAPGKPSTPYVIGSKSTDKRWLDWEVANNENNKESIDEDCHYSSILHYTVERKEVISAIKLKVTKSVAQNPPFLLQDLREGIEYQFRIYAENAFGTSPPSDSSAPYYFNSEDEQPARFKKKLKDVLAKEGERAHFECLVVGSPTPKVKWFKNFCEIFDGHKHNMKHSESGSSHLIINNINEADCGEVECRASNSLGTCSTRAFLTIHSSARLRLTEKTIEGLQFAKDSTVKVRVPLNGRPTPEVAWMREGVPILSSDRISFEQDELSATLTIANCTRADVGLYQIRAKNYIGSDEATFFVYVTDRPSPPPGEPQVSEITDSSCVLSWKPCEDDGGSPIIEYLVEKTDKKTGNKWSLCNSTVFNTLKISNLKTNATYQFRIRAKNIYGIGLEGTPTRPVTITGNSEVDYDKLASMENPVTSDHKLNPKSLKNEISFHKKYSVCEEISRGAHGVMHRAVEKETNRSWLVRFVKCTVVEKMMIRQEIEILSDLNHPNILKLYDAYELDGEVAYVFELISGCDLLSKMVSDSKPLHSEMNCIKYMRQICQAVAHMHKHNVVNVDIRAETIFFKDSNSDQLKLSNFSSSQRLDPSRCVRVLLPTIEHCPPEFLSDSAVSYYTDIWNLGILAYTILSGTQAFPGKSEKEQFENITGPSEVDFADELWIAISNYAQSWIRKCLNKMPDLRMTITEALSHPWLNGEAESKLSDTPLPSKHLMTLNNLTQQKFTKDKLPIGRLAYDGSVFLKMTRCGVALDREIKMELPDLSPEVIEELSNTEVYEGGTARFKCKFHGRPDPSFEWSHDNEELDWSSGKYTPWSRAGVATLEISNVVPRDEGQYVCTANNKHGSSSTVGELSVQEFPSKKYGRSTDQSRRNSQDSTSSAVSLKDSDSRASEKPSSPPRMSGSPQSTPPTKEDPPEGPQHPEGSIRSDGQKMSFKERLSESIECRTGEDATLRCVYVSSERVVSVVWFKDGEELTGKRGNVILKKLHGNVLLLILKNVTCDDEGQYRVEVSNRVSTISSTTHLFVV